jgi:hypothetical protein
MAFIGLAPFRQFQKHIGDTKFCFGTCQKEVDKHYSLIVGEGTVAIAPMKENEISARIQKVLLIFNTAHHDKRS